MSKTKGGGSTKNGRDSNAQRLGVKVFDGTKITAGTIIIRQRGTKVHPGKNVRRASDDSLFSLVDGSVKFGQRRGRKVVDVLPAISSAASRLLPSTVSSRFVLPTLRPVFTSITVRASVCSMTNEPPEGSQTLRSSALRNCSTTRCCSNSGRSSFSESQYSTRSTKSGLNAPMYSCTSL
ncbi:MAG: 50S ribosomal protein L27 [Actinobacteria bacterium]|nr:50S ribosomal protein L27 [Actinomycetota bacterium]